MALDGLLLHKLQENLSQMTPMKINKCSQVSEHEMLFYIRSKAKNCKLMISTHSQYNRINLTNESYQSPAVAGNFGMVLRKYIDGGMIISIRQLGLDRILDFEIIAYDDLSDSHTYHLYVELMGKYANLVLVENNRIIDALKRIPPFENNIRPIFPGMEFTLPTQFEKKDPFLEEDFNCDESLSKQFHGFSPLLSREFIYRIHNHESFRDIMNELENSESLYVYEKENQFHCIELKHLHSSFSVYPLMRGFDVVYYHAQEKERIREQSGDLYKVVKKELHKNTSKLKKLKETLAFANDCDHYRIYGDLLYAYSYQYPQKMEAVDLEDFETGQMIHIPLDVKYDIKYNAKKYYQKYKKSKTAQIEVAKQIDLCEKEIEYFTLLQSQLEYASFDDAKEIRSELEKNGYLRIQKNIRKPKKNALPHFITLNFKGNNIYIGKNNLQNDYLTFHFARKEDWWFHTLDYHGAHVIVQCDELSEEIIRTCAMLASYYSQGKDSSSVPVAYTKIKNLKKAKGKAIGQALMNSYKTIYIDPDEKKVIELLDTYKK